MSIQDRDAQKFDVGQNEAGRGGVCGCLTIQVSVRQARAYRFRVALRNSPAIIHAQIHT